MNGDSIDWHTMATILIGIISTICGWFVRVLWDADRRLREDLHNLERNLPSIYARRDDVRELTDAIFSRFDRIESKIDRINEKNG